MSRKKRPRGRAPMVGRMTFAVAIAGPACSSGEPEPTPAPQSPPTVAQDEPPGAQLSPLPTMVQPEPTEPPVQEPTEVEEPEAAPAEVARGRVLQKRRCQ